MIIIGGDQNAIERLRLTKDPTVEDEDAQFYAVRADSVTVIPGAGRVGDVIPWPEVITDPANASGWYVRGATFDPDALEVNYRERLVTLLEEGTTQVDFVVENADGSELPVSWQVAVKEALRALSAQIIPSAQTDVVVGNPAGFEARPDGGEDPYVIAWYRDGTYLGSGTQLRIPVAGWGDEGNYYYIVRDSLGSVAQSINVRLSVRPLTLRATPITPTVSIAEGENFTYIASASGGKPPFTFAWYKDGVQIAQGQGTSLPLNISDADPDMSVGAYKFTVTDALGNTATSNTSNLVIRDSFLHLEPVGPYDAQAIQKTGVGKYTVTLDRGSAQVVNFSAQKFKFNAPDTPVPDGGVGCTLIGLDSNVATFTQPSSLPGYRYQFRPNNIGTDGTVQLLTADSTGRADIVVRTIELPYFTSQAQSSILIEDFPRQLTYSLKASTVPVTRIQWQIKTPTADWSDIAGANSNTLQISSEDFDVASTSNQYRAVVTNQYGSTTSPLYTVKWLQASGFTTETVGGSQDNKLPGGVYAMSVYGSGDDSWIDDPAVTIAFTSTDTSQMTVTPVPGNKRRANVNIAADAVNTTSRLAAGATWSYDGVAQGGDSSGVGIDAPYFTDGADIAIDMATSDSVVRRVEFLSSASSQLPAGWSLQITSSDKTVVADSTIVVTGGNVDFEIKALKTGTTSLSVAAVYTPPGASGPVTYDVGTLAVNVENSFVPVVFPASMDVPVGTRKAVPLVIDPKAVVLGITASANSVRVRVVPETVNGVITAYVLGLQSSTLSTNVTINVQYRVEGSDTSNTVSGTFPVTSKTDTRIFTMTPASVAQMTVGQPYVFTVDGLGPEEVIVLFGQAILNGRGVVNGNQLTYTPTKAASFTFQIRIRNPNVTTSTGGVVNIAGIDFATTTVA